MGERDLMRHWEAELSCLPIITVQYERLVTNPEHELTRLAEFLGLEYHPVMLEFWKDPEAGHRSDNPSAEQVRQPLYQSSVGRWRLYEEQIARVFQDAFLEIPSKVEPPPPHDPTMAVLIQQAEVMADSNPPTVLDILADLAEKKATRADADPLGRAAVLAHRMGNTQLSVRSV